MAEERAVNLDGLSSFVMDRVNLGVMAVNEDLEIVLWNRFMASHSGRDAAELRGQKLFEAFPDLPKAWLRRKIKTVFLLKSFAFSSWEQRPYLFPFSSHRAVSGSEEFMYQSCTFMPVQGASNRVEQVCITIFDETETALARKELAQAMSRLERESTIDQLTLLPNRRSLDRNMEKAFAAAKRYEAPLSVGLIDLDHFKRVNDTWGHPAGDHVLRTVANVCIKSIRCPDIVARYGGEEFALVFVHTPLQGAMIAAERLRASIEAQEIVFQGNSIPVTASMGITELRPGVSSAAELLNEADQALYRSKQGGRNRVTPFHSLDD